VIRSKSRARDSSGDFRLKLPAGGQPVWPVYYQARYSKYVHGGSRNISVRCISFVLFITAW